MVSLSTKMTLWLVWQRRDTKWDVRKHKYIGGAFIGFLPTRCQILNAGPFKGVLSSSLFPADDLWLFKPLCFSEEAMSVRWKLRLPARERGRSTCRIHSLSDLNRNCIFNCLAASPDNTSALWLWNIGPVQSYKLPVFFFPPLGLFVREAKDCACIL